MYENGVLECQQCGWPLKELTDTEKSKVALAPYEYIVYCDECKKDFDFERKANSG